MADRAYSQLRSSRWFDTADLNGFQHRANMFGQGINRSEYHGRPIVAILNAWDELGAGHALLKQRVEDVKRGVLSTGGFPVELPVMGLCEALTKPTSLLLRNLLAMEVEERIRGLPIDATVCMAASSEALAALAMGIVSADIPSIFLPAGAMADGAWGNQTLGGEVDVRRFHDEYKLGNLNQEQWLALEQCIIPSSGTMSAMETSAAMACVIEALGFTLPNASCIPSTHADHSRLANSTGREAVRMAWEGPKPSKLLSVSTIDNAITTLLALGGCTNAVLNIIAIAGRANLIMSLDRFDELSMRTPVLADLKPLGKHLMNVFFRAGGLPALMNRLGENINRKCSTVIGQSLDVVLAKAEVLDNSVIRQLDQPIAPEASFCVLRGNLAPEGCLIRTSIADQRLLQHRGTVLAFENIGEMTECIDDPDLPVTADSIIVLKGAGPVGSLGCPEWGAIPIPRKLIEAGVKDIIRISDARISTSAMGTYIVHVSPESHIGGPLALVQTGDEIEIDVAKRSIHWHVSQADILKRRSTWKPSKPNPKRGYLALYTKHVTQTHQGCDFEILEGRSGGMEPDIF